MSVPTSARALGLPLLRFCCRKSCGLPFAPLRRYQRSCGQH